LWYGKSGKTAMGGWRVGAKRIIERIWRESGGCFGGRRLLRSGPWSRVWLFERRKKARWWAVSLLVYGLEHGMIMD
jgi:hypothetical protein